MEIATLIILSIILTLTFTTVTVLEVVKILLYKTYTVTDVLGSLLLVILLFILPLNKIWAFLLICFLSLIVLGGSIFYFVALTKKHFAYNKKLSRYLKDSEYDFFLQVDQKNKIRDYGISLLKITGLIKKDVLKKECWNLLFDTLEILTINKSDATTSNFNAFVEEYEKATSKFKTYSFEMDILLKEKTMTYKGIIEPIYLQNKLIGRNIYFYIDRMRSINHLKQELSSVLADMEKLRNQNHAMMSLSDGILLYFDFETKYYVASESFCRFTNTHKREYTFDEIIDFIHPDDLDTYIEQSETINSISVTRLKFRLLINDVYYNVMEDSIYLNTDTDLVSIIRICDKSEESTKHVFSTKEAEKLIESLNDTNIEQVIEKTKNILDTIIGDEDEN